MTGKHIAIKRVFLKTYDAPGGKGFWRLSTNKRPTAKPLLSIIHPHFDSPSTGSYFCTFFIRVWRQLEEPSSSQLAPSWVVRISAIKSPTTQLILHIMHPYFISSEMLPWYRLHTTLTTTENIDCAQSCLHAENVEMSAHKVMICLWYCPHT